MVTFQFIPYHEIQQLSSAKRVNKLLNIVKEDRIVIMEGRLRKEEEADLIEITMEEISPKFKELNLAWYILTKPGRMPLRKYVIPWRRSF